MRPALLLILILTAKFGFSQQTQIRKAILNDVKGDIRKYYYYEQDTSFIFSILDTFYSQHQTLDDFLWDLTNTLRTTLGQKHFDFSSIDTSNTQARKTSYWNKKINKIAWPLKRRLIRKKLNTDAFEYGPVLKLPDNVGYIKINTFENKYQNPTPRTPRFKDVIAKFKDCDAIIIDFLDHRGGAIYQAANLTSYFAPHDSLYLFSSHSPSLDSLKEGTNFYEYYNYFTNNNVPRLKAKKVIVLIGRNTFSAGEHAAYALQKLNKTIVIGDTSAASGLSCNIGFGNKYANFNIPTFKIIDTFNNYSFEKCGVIPDIIDTGDSIIFHAFTIAHIDTTKISILNLKEDFLLNKKYSLVADYGRIKILQHSTSLFIQYNNVIIQNIINNKGELSSRSFSSIQYIASGSYNFIKIVWKNGKQEIYSKR